MKTDLELRREVIDGLRQLADFLDANPGVPVNPWANVSYSVSAEPAGDEADRREVDRVAALLNAAPVTNTAGTHYTVRKAFGPVVYCAAAITAEHMARYDAAVTYADSVTP